MPKIKSTDAQKKVDAFRIFLNGFQLGLTSQLETLQQHDDRRFAHQYVIDAIQCYLAVLKRIEPEWIHTLKTKSSALKQLKTFLSIKQQLETISSNYLPILFHPEKLGDTYELRADAESINLTAYLLEKLTQLNRQFGDQVIAGTKISTKCDALISKLTRVLDHSKKAAEQTRQFEMTGLNLRTQLEKVSCLKPGTPETAILKRLNTCIEYLESDACLAITVMARHPNKQETIKRSKKLTKKYASYLAQCETFYGDSYPAILTVFLNTPLMTTRQHYDLFKLVSLQIQHHLQPLLADNESTAQQYHERLVLICHQHQVDLPPLENPNWLQFPETSRQKTPLDEWTLDTLKLLTAFFWKACQERVLLGQSWLRQFTECLQLLALSTLPRFDNQSKATIVAIESRRMHLLLNDRRLRNTAISDTADHLRQRLQHNKQTALGYLVPDRLYSEVNINDTSALLIVSDELSQAVQHIIGFLLLMVNLMPQRALPAQREATMQIHRHQFIGHLLSLAASRTTMPFDIRRQHLLTLIVDLNVMAMRLGGLVPDNQLQGYFFDKAISGLNQHQLAARFPVTPPILPAVTPPILPALTPPPDPDGSLTEEFEATRAARRRRSQNRSRLHLPKLPSLSRRRIHDESDSDPEKPRKKGFFSRRKHKPEHDEATALVASTQQAP